MSKKMMVMKDKLIKRLTDKGLENNEIDLFIRDVLRNLIDSPWQNNQMIKGRLLLLGWKDAYTDYGTIQLIQACYPDGQWGSPGKVSQLHLN